MRIFAFILAITISHAVFAIEKADHVVVHKSDRLILLLNNDKEIVRFTISLGGNPKDHKQQEGDQRTPEGKYVLDYKKLDSAFYKSIHVSYPNKADKDKAKKLGVSPGGFIMIHGQKNGLGWLSDITQLFDWTDGCIAVTNQEMDQIWEAVDAGTPITINP